MGSRHLDYHGTKHGLPSSGLSYITKHGLQSSGLSYNKAWAPVIWIIILQSMGLGTRHLDYHIAKYGLPSSGLLYSKVWAPVIWIII